MTTTPRVRRPAKGHRKQRYRQNTKLAGRLKEGLEGWIDVRRFDRALSRKLDAAIVKTERKQ